MNKSHYGFILFDDNINKPDNIKTDTMSGVACVYNEKPFHFKKVNELDKTVIWYSNLSKDSVWRTGKNYIKDKDFLGYEALYSNIITDLDKEKTAEIFAKLFAQVMYAYEHFCKEQNIPFNVTELLQEDIYQKFMQKSYNHKTEDVMRHFFKEAYVEKVKMAKEGSQNKRDDSLSFTFMLETDYYVEQVLSENIPVGNWTKINIDNKSPNQIKQNLAGCFIKIDNLKINPVFSKIDEARIWQGTRGFLLNGTVIDELWITEKEFHFLENKAEFKILEVWKNGRFANMKSFFSQNLFKENLFKNNDLRTISLVYQIIKKLFLKSFISTGYMPKTREKFPFSENMIWFRVREREVLFPIVKKLIEQFEFRIKEYGNGEITVYAKEVDKIALINFLLQENFIVPTFLIKQNLKDIQLPNNKSAIDFKLKHRFHNKVDYHHFINQLCFIYNKDKETLNGLVQTVKKLSFTEEDEKDREFGYFLKELNEILRRKNE